MSLTPEQIDVLLLPIKMQRVKSLDGHSHVEGYDIRAMLIRIFGFGGWDEVAVTPTTLLYDMETTTKKGDNAYKVAYRASRRLVIRDHDGNQVACYEGSAVGESTMPHFKRGDGHDMAIKTAETQALKRAASNLGDQFGLSLYRKGSLKPLVVKIVGHTASTADDAVVEVDADREIDDSPAETTSYVEPDYEPTADPNSGPNVEELRQADDELTERAGAVFAKIKTIPKELQAELAKFKGSRTLGVKGMASNPAWLAEVETWLATNAPDKE